MVSMASVSKNSNSPTAFNNKLMRLCGTEVWHLSFNAIATPCLLRFLIGYIMNDLGSLHCLMFHHNFMWKMKYYLWLWKQVGFVYEDSYAYMFMYTEDQRNQAVDISTFHFYVSNMKGRITLRLTSANITFGVCWRTTKMYWTVFKFFFFCTLIFLKWGRIFVLNEYANQKIFLKYISSTVCDGCISLWLFTVLKIEVSMSVCQTFVNGCGALFILVKLFLSSYLYFLFLSHASGH